MNKIDELIDGYIVWLKDKTTLRTINNWVEITTPHLDRHNDYIQIYVKIEESGNIILTDDGYTIDDLLTSGCAVDASAKRRKMLEMILNGFGVQRNEKTQELHVNANSNNFAIKKHSLLQAILAVNDLFVLSKPNIETFFLDDVNIWLDDNDIRYVPATTFIGRSGFEHKFDFVIPKSKKAPERLINTINNPRKDTVQTAAFHWIDTKEVRQEGSKAFFILNDNQKIVSDDIKHAFNSYGITPILWSDREEYMPKLVA